MIYALGERIIEFPLTLITLSLTVVILCVAYFKKKKML